MSRVLTYLGRFFIILVGYLAASLAASAFLNVVFLGSAGFTVQEVPFIAAGSLVFSIPFVALFVAYFAFVPAVPAILLAEILGKRDWLYYAVAGGVIAMVVLGFFWTSASEMYGVSDALEIASRPDETRSAISDPSLAMMVVGAGMCGGLAYWLVAGRLAGNWRIRTGEAGATSPER